MVTFVSSIKIRKQHVINSYNLRNASNRFTTILIYFYVDQYVIITRGAKNANSIKMRELKENRLADAIGRAETCFMLICP